MIDSEKPWKFVCPEQWPSEAITTVSPICRDACMTLFSEPGGNMPGGSGSGAFLVAHQHLHFRAQRLPVKRYCFFTTTVEEQVRLDLHGISFRSFPHRLSEPVRGLALALLLLPQLGSSYPLPPAARRRDFTATQISSLGHLRAQSTENAA